MGLSDHETFLDDLGITELRPAQEKAIAAGVLNGKSVLVCTPTASGKTLVAELAIREAIQKGKKALYIVPLRALGAEKYREFRARHDFRVGISIGDYDAADKELAQYDLIIATAEKLDSLLRHHAPWLSRIGLVVVDEIHLLNDAGRGPTLEILITMLRQRIDPQILALSATVGNASELAEWLGADLVADDWRPVELRKGVFIDDSVEFPDE